jgi:dual specificity tyrosine-phosphorylation-regulated kinase 2/3/4
MSQIVDIENSKAIKQIGLGGFGKIYLCKDRNGNEFVSKQIDNEKSFINEVNIYSELLEETNYFPKFYNYFNGDFKKCIFIENCQQDLKQMIENKEDIATEFFILHMAEALQVLQEKNIIHCDLKPENILYDSNSDLFKICDFGISCYNNKKTKMLPVQTVYYRAPEVIFRRNYSFSIDIWSLGCIIYELVNYKILLQYTKEEECFLMMMIRFGMPPKKLFPELYSNNIKYVNNLPVLCNCDNMEDTYIIEDNIKLKNDTIDKTIKGCLKWNPKLRLTPRKIIDLFSEFNH